MLKYILYSYWARIENPTDVMVQSVTRKIEDEEDMYDSDLYYEDFPGYHFLNDWVVEVKG